MSVVSQHLEYLLREEGVLSWGGYVNMLKTLESAFPSPKHWILEFLQNAEDAGASRISIRLGGSSLSVLNNGNTFSKDDFHTICDVKSRKRPSLGFRGYIGIGFKSIFRVTDHIDVHSGNLHFSFDKGQWSDSRRSGTPLAEWPWEILPLEISPLELAEGYTTGFFVPLESVKGQEVLDEIGGFLAGDEFPKEAILLLQNVEVIEVQTPQRSFTVSKETRDSETLPSGTKKEVMPVWKQEIGQPHREESLYLIFRTAVEVPDYVRADGETERTRRADIREREIGLVFSLDAEHKLQPLSGKLAGVYSFLPIEGEQTGLPFGIFGDFIPQIGRDLINYRATWNEWMCREIVQFFEQTVIEVFVPHGVWRSFPAGLLAGIEFALAPGPGNEFWDSRLRVPIKHFLMLAALYPDQQDKPSRLQELIIVEDEIVQLIGRDTLEAIVGKRIAHDSIASRIRGWAEVLGKEDLLSRGELLEHIKGQPEKLSDLPIETTYQIMYSREMLEPLKGQPERLVAIYRSIMHLNDYRIGGRDHRDETPLYATPFVLADNGELYPPNQMMTLEADVAHVPEFLLETLPNDKKLLHPAIAKDTEAVSQLARCRLEVVSKRTVTHRIQQLVAGITSPDQCPGTWTYPDDLIKATVLLIAAGGTSLKLLVARDGILRAPASLFAPATSLDWSGLWASGKLPGFEPIHGNYLSGEWIDRSELERERLHQYFEEAGVHGFRREEDKPLIETAAYAIAKEALSGQGHQIADVTQRDKLGYDLECHDHCSKVFEVKGMSEPKDVALEESQVAAAQQKGSDYVLICVYNLPTQPSKAGYKEIPDPQSIWDPVEKAKVRRRRWHTA